jgi:hypothetical protein
MEGYVGSSINKKEFIGMTKRNDVLAWPGEFSLTDKFGLPTNIQDLFGLGNPI